MKYTTIYIRRLLPILLLLAFMPRAAAQVAIDATNFPDQYFRAWVQANYDDGNGYLDEAKADTLTTLIKANVTDGANVTDLTGIKYFQNIEVISWNSGMLTSLDVSGCSALRHLRCSANQLTSIDVSGCTALTILSCYGNQLTSLDLSGCTAIVYLNCITNQLTSLNVSGCNALTTLKCSKNQLTSLDVSDCTALKELECYNNLLTVLDLQKNTALTTLDCSYNNLSSLWLEYNPLLESVNCGSQRTSVVKPYKIVFNGETYYFIPIDDAVKGDLKSFDDMMHELEGEGTNDAIWFGYSWCVKGWTGDAHEDDTGKFLILDGPSSTATYNYWVGLVNNPNFDENQTYPFTITWNEVIDLGETTLIPIDEEHFPDYQLRKFASTCDNGLGYLDMDKAAQKKTLSYNNVTNTKGIEYFTNLEEITLEYGTYESLDVSGFTKLRTLYCSYGKLETIDVTNCGALTGLRVNSNSLTELDVTTCTALTDLRCGENSLSTLDVRNCTALEILSCSYNSLNALDVSHNILLKDIYCVKNNLTSLELYKNTNLENVDFEPQNELTIVPYHRLVDGEIQYFLYIYDADGSTNSLKSIISEHEGSGFDPDIAFDPQYIYSYSGATLDGNVLVLDSRSGSFTYNYNTHFNETGESGQLAPVTLKWTTTRPLTSGTIPIDEEHFPDESLRNWARSYYNDGNDYLDDILATAATRLGINRNNYESEIYAIAQDLTGIEYFPNLNTMQIAGTITKLDLTKNTKLTSLLMAGNSLNSIDLSKNTELISLMIRNNPITALDLSHNDKLKTLVCNGNLLTSLDLSHNPNINSFTGGPQQVSTIVPYRREVDGETQYFLFLNDATKGNNQSLADMIHTLEGENVDDEIRFDVSRAADWGGDCTLDGDILVLTGESGSLTYNYDTGSNAGSVEFTLTWIESQEAEPAGLRGDANNDGKVTVLDIVAVANYILGDVPAVFNFANADVTGDGKINVTVLVNIANITLGE